MKHHAVGAAVVSGSLGRSGGKRLPARTAECGGGHPGRTGPYGARALVEEYLRRIDEIDRSGPALRAIIELNPDARLIADQLDRERQSKGRRGPLHGIPVILKDNID